ncbi:hypothetical protein [Clostridium drakei]|uniref:Uncharacterized protein n=1 Tax=Clostridium drakei TaxID=332101 RepID=A0A2U8DWV1_9CLOT|nr:hypothetical protein [Clostridium drakei]AWI06734.1 hypothetical protein B9W14_20285 [Clostridium drakei]
MLISKKISRAYDTVKLYLENGDGSTLSNGYLEQLRNDIREYHSRKKDDDFLRQAYEKEVKLMKIHLEKLNEMQSDEENIEYAREMIDLIGTRLLWHRKFSLLNEILEYVVSLRWVTRAESKSRMRILIETGYNYETTAKRFNVSVHSVRAMASYTLGNLEKKLGKDTIDILMNGEVEKAELQFRIGTGSFVMNEIFVKGVFRLIPEGRQQGNMNLLECFEELKYLKSLTILEVRKKLSALKTEKLEHIIGIFESSDSRYVYEKAIIYRYLNGNMNELKLKELLEELEDEDILKKKFMEISEDSKEKLEQ